MRIKIWRSTLVVQSAQDKYDFCLSYKLLLSNYFNGRGHHMSYDFKLIKVKLIYDWLNFNPKFEIEFHLIGV